MESSSPQGDRLLRRSADAFKGQILVAPSSPSATYQDGEISPSFDASFASSMSITSDERSNPSPLGRGAPILAAACSSPAMPMDISPAPHAHLGAGSEAPAAIRAPPNLRPLALFGRHASQPTTATASSLAKPDHPFLKSLFRGERSAPPTQTSFPHIAPLSIPRAGSPVDLTSSLESTSLASTSRIKKPRSRPTSSTGAHQRRPSLTHFATVPPSEAEKSQPPFATAGFSFASRDNDAPASAGEDSFFGAPEGTLRQQRFPPPSRPRSALPSMWNRSSNSLAPPLPPVKRQSEPSVHRTRQNAAEASPFRMQIDGSSPHGLASPVALRPGRQPRSVSDSITQRSPLSPGGNSSPSSSGGAAEALGEYFEDEAQDSPIPPSRKRFLEQENSPIVGSPTPANHSNNSSLGRRAFDKVNTIGGTHHVARRQRSAIGLNLSRRPSLASFGNASGSTCSIPSESSLSSSSSSFNKRFATQAHDGRPSHSRRNSRRALSVADAVAAGVINVPHSPALLGGGLFARDLNVPMDSPQPGPIKIDGSDYFAGGPSGKKLGAPIDLGPAVKACMSPEAGSPIAGFRQQEARGKALPCFNVKEDGLMRITPATLNALQNGDFGDKHIASYQVIDCRFDYEYEGGHIKDAINLSEMADVENALLNIATVPRPSTSERPLAEGRTVLIFHCEFSAKRAPTSAKHLRNVDRVRNAAEYPRVHYPEVYVLQGGYEAFYRAYPERCSGGYVVMDHPEHDAKRSVNLDKFRKQKGVFNRASSFTFGQAQHASALLRNAENDSRRPLSFNPRKALEPSGFEFPSRQSLSTTPSGSKSNKLSVHDEDGEADSSFGTNGSSPCGNGGSPCPLTSKLGGRGSSKLPSQPFSLSSKLLNPKRPLAGRAQTSGILSFAR
ncbi:putative tyrosine protein phosphatase MIH1 [Sporobolomyces koalae]|uniref:putative tyrosine protein phosphatase MIH1 n=1 Tax=Sporobolomyces koalae TaxID=500713 RepID=UPI00316B5FD2